MRVIETTYAGTGGVLIGSGARWLLLDADPSLDEIEALWSLVTGPGPAVDAIVGLLETQHPLGLPSLALLDLSAGGVESASRGSGRVTLDDGGRLLTLGGTHGRPERRLVGGVVSAGCARVREVAVPAPAPDRALIDAVPAHILVATAPERDHDVGRWARALDSAPRSAVTDHDGRTTVRPAPEADAPSGGRHATSETVLAVRCPAGHLTAAYTPECRVCHRPVAAQDPQRVPRPRVGALTLPTGEVVPLDRGVALGRKPRPVPGGEPYPHLVHLPAESTYLSRLHLQVELDGWLVLARDLGSSGGTRLHVPGREPEQLRPHEAYVLEHGTTLDLADVYPVVFEVVG